MIAIPKDILYEFLESSMLPKQYLHNNFTKRICKTNTAWIIKEFEETLAIINNYNKFVNLATYFDPNKIYTATEYYQDVMTLDNVKFILRFPVLVKSNNFYVGKQSLIFTANDFYSPYDLSYGVQNCKKLIDMLYPAAFQKYGMDRFIPGINRQIENIVYALCDNLSPDLYGFDFIILENNVVKLVNAYVGPDFGPLNNHITRESFWIPVYNLRYRQLGRPISEIKPSYPPYPLLNETVKFDREAFIKSCREFKPTLEFKNPKTLKKYYPKFKGKHLFIRELGDAYQYINTTTDLFTEECRIQCVFLDNPSPLQYWIDNHANIPKDVRATDHILSQIRFCNNFKITIALAILQIFQPRSWLDISAGWGDRLLAAIGYGKTSYYATDPNPCLKPKYSEIISQATNNEHTNKRNGKYFVDSIGFEDLVLPKHKFDLVFSSPPFFDLEIYSDSPGDSYVRHSTEISWYEGFLKPSVIKSATALRYGGHMVLYIGESRGTKYLEQLFKDLEKYVKYRGQIHYYYLDKKYARTMHVWQRFS